MHAIISEKESTHCRDVSASLRRASRAIMGLIFVAIFAAPAFANAAADPKVTICHFPPGNPSNYQTITVASSALKAHLAHGDFGGACKDDCNLFSSVCDDGNLCTTDACNGDGTCSHTTVNCDDGNSCTNDTCNPATGCASSPAPGRSCVNTKTCQSTSGLCTNTGDCVGAAIPNCCQTSQDCVPQACSTGTCTNIVNGAGSCSYAPVVCTGSDACNTAVCDPSEGTNGTCVTAAITCNNGDSCQQGSCSLPGGCSFSNIGNPGSPGGCCNSLHPCGTGYSCSSGTCVATACPYPAGSISLPGQCGPNAGEWGKGSWSNMASITIITSGPRTQDNTLNTYTSPTGQIGPFPNCVNQGFNFSGVCEVQAYGTDLCGATVPLKQENNLANSCP